MRSHDTTGTRDPPRPFPPGEPPVLDRRGLALLREVDERTLATLLTKLGTVVLTTDVRLAAGVGTYLASREAIPLHTDDPLADFVVWRCVAQDPEDGASRLADGRVALGRLGPADVAVLRDLRLRYRGLDGVRREAPVLADDGSVFFAPWLVDVSTDPWRRAVAQRLGDALARSSVAVRLHPGDVLIIDNHRWLHGRDAVAPESARYLVRSWISRNRGG